MLKYISEGQQIEGEMTSGACKYCLKICRKNENKRLLAKKTYS
jgi:hypothetical protein